MRGLDGPAAAMPGRHGVVVVQPPQVLSIPRADRFQSQAPGEPDTHRLGDNIAQPTVAVAATLHHQLEVVRADPGVGVVLAGLQPGRPRSPSTSTR
jgi:hypothetical protein